MNNSGVWKWEELKVAGLKRSLKDLERVIVRMDKEFLYSGSNPLHEAFTAVRTAYVILGKYEGHGLEHGRDILDGKDLWSWIRKEGEA